MDSRDEGRMPGEGSDGEREEAAAERKAGSERVDKPDSVSLTQ